MKKHFRVQAVREEAKRAIAKHEARFTNIPNVVVLRAPKPEGK